MCLTCCTSLGHLSILLKHFFHFFLNHSHEHTNGKVIRHTMGFSFFPAVIFNMLTARTRPPASTFEDHLPPTQSSQFKDCAHYWQRSEQQQVRVVNHIQFCKAPAWTSVWCLWKHRHDGRAAAPPTEMSRVSRMIKPRMRHSLCVHERTHLMPSADSHSAWAQSANATVLPVVNINFRNTNYTARADGKQHKQADAAADTKNWNSTIRGQLSQSIKNVVSN